MVKIVWQEHGHLFITPAKAEAKMNHLVFLLSTNVTIFLESQFLHFSCFLRVLSHRTSFTHRISSLGLSTNHLRSWPRISIFTNQWPQQTGTTSIRKTLPYELFRIWCRSETQDVDSTTLHHQTMSKKWHIRLFETFLVSIQMCNKIDRNKGLIL